MEGKPQDFMTVGLIHFMAYPAVMQGEGPILESIKAICDDDYFDAIEVTTIRDAGVRKQAVEMARGAKMTVGFGAQPMLLAGKHDLNSPEPETRRRAMDLVRSAMDEATEWDATAVAVLSGPDPGGEARDLANTLLIASLKELSEYARTRNAPPVLLETFDRVDFGKNCLIGPTVEATALAKQVVCYYRSFGLMLDLSHLPLLDETAEHALTTAVPCLKHVHIGNCVKSHADHPAYGDNHPMFGIPEGENGVAELAEFLRVLLDIGYVARGGRKVVSFEVKPYGGQTPEEVIQNAKQTLDAAWTSV